MSINRKQKMMLFFSADLSQSTAFKDAHPVAKTRDGELNWQQEFAKFFEDFRDTFLTAARNVCRELRGEEESPRDCLAIPTLWKMNGDELLFKSIAFDDCSYMYIYAVVRAFYETVLDFDRRLTPKGLGVHGCAWTAGFPIRNTEIHTPALTFCLTSLRSSHDAGEGFHDADTGSSNDVDDRVLIDYIGVDIDAGFRLASNTPSGRVAASLDLAWFLAKYPGYNDANAMGVCHVGWARLKGVIGGNPYPIFWLSCRNAEAYRRTPWDHEFPESSVADFQRKYFKDSKNPMAPGAVSDLAQRLRKTLPNYLIEPYISSFEMHPSHLAIWSANSHTPASNLSPDVT